MNERIQELAQQAQEYAGRQIDEGANWDDAPIYYTEKLAELIIRECMRMCDCADVSLLEHNRPQEASGAAGAKQFIKEWFEVEE